jgi:hypothetical protein
MLNSVNSVFSLNKEKISRRYTEKTPLSTDAALTSLLLRLNQAGKIASDHGEICDK